MSLHFEHIVEPVGAFFPGHAAGFTHAEFNGWLATGAFLLALGAMLFVYGYYWKGLFAPLHGLAERSRLARFGKTVLENKYYLDWLYTDVIVAFVKWPLAKAAYWFNQVMLDGVVNGAGESAVKAGRFVYERIDQGVVDGAVNGTALVANETGGGLRKVQSGRVQQYAALLFAAAAIMAGVFVLVVS
jgi:NADH-quinone oxidoreductase subunit L